MSNTMSEFEDNVLRLVPELKAADDAESADRLRRIQLEVIDQRLAADRIKQQRLIGAKAAQLLHDQGVPALPVVVRDDTIGEGWHIMSGMATMWYAGEPIEQRRNYTLRADGALEQFAPNRTIDSLQVIRNPTEVDDKVLDTLLEGDNFKRAVASLIAGLGVYDIGSH
jgi:hypothetical protein